MRIRQVVVLADESRVVKDFLTDLEQLGLDIIESSVADMMNEIATSSQTTNSERLVVCDPGFESSPPGLAIIRHAIGERCGILVGSAHFEKVLEEIKEGNLTEDTRKELAAQALCSCIAQEAKELEALQRDRYKVQIYEKVQDLRYGENWHQASALYRTLGGTGLYEATKIQGKEMSYNNVVDAEATLEMLMDLTEYDGVRDDRKLAVIVKHANPCGVAYGNDLREAYRRALATDPKSAFGGVIGFSERVDEDMAEDMRDHFIEVMLAPGYEPGALEILGEKPNRRILDIDALLERKEDLYTGWYGRSIFGGMLLQDYDTSDIKKWKVVTEREPTPEETRALRFAWKVTKYVKSNALVYATENQTIGIGSGQVSRVDSARFGAEKANEHGLDTKGTVAATDSFFPFRDGLDETYRAGATAVVHPGGSIRDAEVIDAANEHGMAMVFTEMRHFRH